MNAKHILGTVTIIAIIGGTIYAIKKSKDALKSEGEEITLDDARKIVENENLRHKDTGFDSAYPTYFKDKNVENLDDYISYAREDAEMTAKLVEDLEEQEAPYAEEAYEENDDNFDEQYEEHINHAEGDEELRYEPNSREARHQFVKMELAEWVPLEDSYQILQNLFEFPFIPQNDGDYDLKTRVMDYRAQFFGFDSKWTRDVSIADIILYYARKAEFNCGESVRYWADYFLEFNAFDINTPSRVVDDILKNLNAHTFFNEERATFGLFGLTRESMNQAITIANRNIDRSVTYEIEFNEFLKSCI
jgi:hypothetical protein